MNNPPLLSVIIPVYNAEAYLCRCLDSVLGQTLRDIEVIVVNDGSTDNSLQICKNYAKHDSRIHLIDQANAGPAAARNKGMQAARGEWLWFIDADDFIQPDACQVIAEHTPSAADIILFGSNIYHNGKMHNTPYFSLDILKLTDRFTINSHPQYISAVPATLWNKVFKKTFLNRHHIRLDEDLFLCDDNLFSLHACLYADAIDVIHENLYNYHQESASSISSHCKHWEDVILCSKKSDALLLKARKTGYYPYYISRNINGLFYWLDTTSCPKAAFYSEIRRYFSQLPPALYDPQYLQREKFYERFLTVKHYSYRLSHILRYKKPNPDTTVITCFHLPVFKRISTPFKIKKYILGLCISSQKALRLHTPAVPKSPEKEIKRLKNKFAGKGRLFIIGNGPSVKKMDLSVLNNEYTFVVSRGYLLKEQGLRHASFYCFSDKYSYISYGHDIDLDFADLFFASTWTGWNKCPHKTYLFDEACVAEMAPHHFFQFDITRPLAYGRTAVLNALQIAVYLGFKEIYFLGVDLSFGGAERHFYKSSPQEQQPQHIHWAVENAPKMIANFKTADELLRPRGVRMYNAGIGGALNTLPRVDFYSLFKLTKEKHHEK